MRILIGIDDTDNKESRGTGFRARSLAKALVNEDLLSVDGITRHQLLVDSRIPYTSHNSAACISGKLDGRSLDDCLQRCRAFLIEESAEGSDAGLCVAAWEEVGEQILEFGSRAKKEVLNQDQAIKTAQNAGLFLEGLTGDFGGIIGALAAVGLRNGGNDGRFIWLNRLRKVTGIHKACDLKQLIAVDQIKSLEGNCIEDSERIDVGQWLRPIMQEGKTVLLVEGADGEDNEWRVAPKHIIKAQSS